MKTSSGRARGAYGLLVAALVACLTLFAASAASADGGKGRDGGGRDVPDSKISIQLWTFAEYIGFGTDAATIARTEEVFRSLRDMGYRNVEPFTLSGLSAGGLSRPSRQVQAEGLRPARQRRLAGEPGGHRADPRGEPDARDPVLRLRSNAELRHGSRVDRLRRVPQRARCNGAEAGPEADGPQPQLGVPARVRRPDGVRHPHGAHRLGEGRLPARPVLGDQRRGRAGRGARALRQAHPAVPCEGHGGRPVPGPIEIVGEGIIDFPKIFREAKGHIRYYVVEHDPRFGDPTFDPFEAAEKGFDYLDRVKF